MIFVVCCVLVFGSQLMRVVCGALLVVRCLSFGVCCVVCVVCSCLADASCLLFGGRR